MKKTYLATAVAALFASPITTAIAADTLLDDVVVSSSRSEQRSFDAPGSIQSVGREVIQSSGPQVNLSEALASVPGVTILNRQNYAQDLQVSIRGFGARTKFGVRGVRLIIDGIPATIPDGQGQSSSISLTSTDRIEVLRGPIAQLYGNSAGGVIQTFTRDAPNQPELLVQGYTGSYDTNRTDWQYAQKIGQFGLVADYSTFKTDGYRQNSQTERNQFNGKFTYEHDDRTKISLVANVFDMPYAYDPKGLNWSDAQSNPQKSSNYGLAQRYRKIIKQEQLGGIFERKIDSNLHIKTYVYAGHRENTHINAGNNFVGLDRDYGGFGLELQKKSNLVDMPIMYVVGGNYDKSREINNRGSVNPSTGEITNPYSDRKENRQAKNSDIYAQGTLQFADKWSTTAGFRGTRVQLSSNDILNSAYGGEKTFNAINPVLGLTYHYAENLNFYTNYGKGFETPTLGELGYVNSGASTTTSGWNPTLQASKSFHYEAGMKWLVTPMSRIDSSIFYIQTKNEILIDRGVTNSSYRNVGDTTRKGFELSGQSFFTKSTKGLISLSYVDAVFDNSATDSGSAGIGTVVPGYKLPGIPRGQLFTQIQWSDKDFQRNKYRQVVGGVATVEWVGNGRIYVADNNNYTGAGKAYAPGYSVYNLRFAYKWDVNSVTLGASADLNNFTDKRYVGSVIVSDSAGLPFEPAPGRNWMLGLNATARF